MVIYKHLAMINGLSSRNSINIGTLQASLLNKSNISLFYQSQHKHSTLYIPDPTLDQLWQRTVMWAGINDSLFTITWMIGLLFRELHFDHRLLGPLFVILVLKCWFHYSFFFKALLYRGLHGPCQHLWNPVGHCCLYSNQWAISWKTIMNIYNSIAITFPENMSARARYFQMYQYRLTVLPQSLMCQRHLCLPWYMCTSRPCEVSQHVVHHHFHYFQIIYQLNTWERVQINNNMRWSMTTISHIGCLDNLVWPLHSTSHLEGS